VSRYPLGAGDRVQAQVWNGNELLDQELTVADDGSVMVPFGINRLVTVEGMTVLEMRELLRVLLAERYLDLEV